MQQLDISSLGHAIPSFSANRILHKIPRTIGGTVTTLHNQVIDSKIHLRIAPKRWKIKVNHCGYNFLEELRTMKSIREDYRRYKFPLFAQGFWASSIHRYGMLARGTRYKIIRIPAKIIHFILIKFSEVFLGVYIGPNAQIGKGFLIEHTGCIVINSDAKIGDYARIRHGVTIGNKVADRPREVPVIGDYVDVGAGAKILGPIKIGNNVAIGANAVVLCDVPDDCIAVGIPARVLVKRSDKTT